MQPSKAKKLMPKAKPKPKAAGGPNYTPVSGPSGSRWNHGGKC